METDTVTLEARLKLARIFGFKLSAADGESVVDVNVKGGSHTKVHVLNHLFFPNVRRM